MGVNGSKNGKQVANFAGCEILQVAKIFATLQNFEVAQVSSFFCSSFRWFMICKTEFNSDSSCLS